jgi:thioesterase domain-containing protein
VNRNTRVRDDLGVRIPRLVVADLTACGEDVALARARAASAEGQEVVFLGACDPVATAWVVRAEDAPRVHVVADEARAQALRAALVDLDLADVEVSVTAPG